MRVFCVFFSSHSKKFTTVCVCLTLDCRFASHSPIFGINKITETATELCYVFGILINKIYCFGCVFCVFRPFGHSFCRDYRKMTQSARRINRIRSVQKRKFAISGVYNLRDSFRRCTMICEKVNAVLLPLPQHSRCIRRESCDFHWRFIFNSFSAYAMRIFNLPVLNFSKMNYMCLPIVNCVTVLLQFLSYVLEIMESPLSCSMPWSARCGFRPRSLALL